MRHLNGYKRVLELVGLLALYGMLQHTLLGAPADFTPLDALLANSAVWQDGADEFMLTYAPLKFNFVSNREVARSTSPELSILGFRVWEALAYFQAGAVERVELSLFNRGDAGDLDEAGFERLHQGLKTAMVKWGGSGRSGQAMQDRGRKTVRHHLWAKTPCAVQLTWAFTDAQRSEGVSTPFRADFIKLSLAYSPQGGIAGMASVRRSSLKQGPVSGYTLRQNVKRDSEGCWLVTDVPMVDQGQKGYCAAATAERLLRYYGRDIDQHEVAQLANTARQRGTTTTGMLDALRTIGRQYQLDVKNLFDMGYNDLVRVAEDYNKEARKKKRSAVVVGDSIDVGALYNAMDASLLKQSSARRSADASAFYRDVKSHIDAGVPLIWACVVGKYPENPPLNIEGAFCHIRLIIGYHPDRPELVYTDSWGPGHERKQMPLADAWAMTFGLYAMKPRDVR